MSTFLHELVQVVGEDRVREIESLCRPLRRGMDLVEFTADAPDSSKVESLLDFIISLSDRRLAYYLLGRMYSMEQLPRVITAQSVVALLRDTDTADSAYHEGAEFSWADDPAATRTAIVDALRTVWDGYLRDRLSSSRHQ